MAINNFESAEIDGTGALVLGGVTAEADGGSIGFPVAMNLGAGAEIQVIVVSVDDPGKQCVPVVDNPSTTPWKCISPKGEHDFEPCDRVLAFGAALSSAVALFTWVQELKIEPCAKG